MPRALSPYSAIRYGDYGKDKPEWRKIDGKGEAAIRAYIKELFGEKFTGDPIQSLINVAQIEESRILKAPLAEAAGGWGQIEGWKSTKDESYKKMQALIEAALR